MTLPASGAISLSQVNTELGLPSTANISMGNSNVYFYNNTSSVVGLWDVGANRNRFTTDASGNFVATGDITAFSDERLKDNWRDLEDAFVEGQAGVKVGIYDRKDTGETQVGVGAKSLQGVLPQAVRKGADGFLSVAYGNAALAAAVVLARRLLSVEKKLGV